MGVIKAGRYSTARWVKAHSSGGPIKPSLIVIHDTAGASAKGSSVRWFQSKDCKTSAHFVIERDGEVVQLVSTDHKAFHAGESSWNGKTFCNSFSIGIEMVNPGYLTRKGSEAALVYPGGKVVERHALDECRTDGTHLCLPYTEAQLEAVKTLCRALMVAYEDVNEIVGHRDISPGRKVDPIPMFPFDEVRDFARGGGDVIEAEAAETAPLSMATSKEGNIQIVNGTAGAGTAVIDGPAILTRIVEKGAEKGSAPGLWDIATILVTSPGFWGAVVAIGAGVSWYFRAQKRWHRGI